MLGPLLQVSLQAAVPLWILRMRDYTPVNLQRIAEECAVTIGSSGDALMFRRKDTSKAFNALAQGIAAAVLLVGEVHWNGMHFTRDSAAYALRGPT